MTTTENEEAFQALVRDVVNTPRATAAQTIEFNRRRLALGRGVQELTAAVTAALNEGRRSGRREAATTDGRILIEVGRRLLDIQPLVLSALIAHGRLFSQGFGEETKIVRVMRYADATEGETLAAQREADLLEEEVGVQTLFQEERLLTVNAVMLARATEQAARVFKYKVEGRGANAVVEEVECDLPKQVAQDLLDSAEMGQLPKLRGVTHVPLLRGNGELYATAGYDRVSQMWVAGSCPTVDVPVSPTEEQARDSLNALKWLLHKYEFATPRDEIGGVAVMLTAVLRGSMDKAPLIASTASQPRTGKDHLLYTAALISTGAPPTMFSAGSNREEREKRMSQIFHTAAPVTVLSNINGRFESDDLCVFLSEGSVIARSYGNVGSAKRAEYSGMWCLSGNNFEARGDLVTRCLTVRQQTETDTPGSRTFDFDCHQWLKDGAGRYKALEWCYTIARWWLQTGRFASAPLGGTNGFDKWSQLVRAPLFALTGEDVFASTIEAEVEQRELSPAGSFVEAAMQLLDYDRGRNRTRFEPRMFEHRPDGYVFHAGHLFAAAQRAKADVVEWHRGQGSPSETEGETRQRHLVMEAVSVMFDEAAGGASPGKSGKHMSLALLRYKGIPSTAGIRVNEALDASGVKRKGGPDRMRPLWALTQRGRNTPRPAADWDEEPEPNDRVLM